jgi:integrase
MWKKRLKPSSIYVYNHALKNLVRNIAAMCARPDLLAQVPRCHYPEARKTICDPGEIEKLLAGAQPWLQTLILLAADAGLRRSDALKVGPEHYDADAATITIKMQKTKHSVTVPVTQRLAAALQAATPCQPGTPFAESQKGNRITESRLACAWQSLKKKTGVNPELWFHDLRRTVAVAIYEVSKDLRIVEQLLGHRNLSSTVRYLEHRDPAKLRPYLEAMHKPKSEVIH